MLCQSGDGKLNRQDGAVHHCGAHDHIKRVHVRDGRHNPHIFIYTQNVCMYMLMKESAICLSHTLCYLGVRFVCRTTQLSPLRRQKGPIEDNRWSDVNSDESDKHSNKFRAARGGVAPHQRRPGARDRGARQMPAARASSSNGGQRRIHEVELWETDGRGSPRPLDADHGGQAPLVVRRLQRGSARGAAERTQRGQAVSQPLAGGSWVRSMLGGAAGTGSPSPRRGVGRQLLHICGCSHA